MRYFTVRVIAELMSQSYDHPDGLPNGNWNHNHGDIVDAKTTPTSVKILTTSYHLYSFYLSVTVMRLCKTSEQELESKLLF